MRRRRRIAFLDELYRERARVSRARSVRDDRRSERLQHEGRRRQLRRAPGRRRGRSPGAALELRRASRQRVRPQRDRRVVRRAAARLSEAPDRRADRAEHRRRRALHRRSDRGHRRRRAQHRHQHLRHARARGGARATRPIVASVARADVLRALIGDRPLREAQRAVLERVDAGQNTLAVLGTGRGKSLCFQYPGGGARARARREDRRAVPAARAGERPVRSAVRRLEPLGIRIHRANGAIDAAERAALNDALESGAWDIICATPEFVQFHLDRFRSERVAAVADRRRRGAPPVRVDAPSGVPARRRVDRRAGQPAGARADRDRRRRGVREDPRRAADRRAG